MNNGRTFVAGASAGAVMGLVVGAWLVHERQDVREDWLRGYHQAMLAPGVVLKCDSTMGQVLDEQLSRLANASEPPDRLDLIEVYYLRSKVAECMGDVSEEKFFLEKARMSCSLFRAECDDRYLKAVGGRRFTPLLASTALEEDDVGDQIGSNPENTQ